MAGAISAINDASVIIAPVLGVALYKWSHPSPYLMNVVVLAGLVAYALIDPVMRRVGDARGPARGPRRVPGGRRQLDRRHGPPLSAGKASDLQ